MMQIERMKMDVEKLAAMIDEAAWVAKNLFDGRARPAGMKGWWPDGMPLRVLG
jgi:hypothetical protein